MSHFNDNNELILTKEEASALQEVLSCGITSGTLRNVGLDELEEMLFSKFGDVSDDDMREWIVLGEKGNVDV